ncbi:MAG: HPr family phosphocarrier protein [Lachnospiraceae bacterium]|nr:HPr family phosphocarrier protein [Lachnospiraceae bacterium]
MVSKTVQVVNAEGMHMRPAGIIAKAAKAHPDSEVIMKVNGAEIKAKAVMQIMAAGIKKGTDVEVFFL